MSTFVFVGKDGIYDMCGDPLLYVRVSIPLYLPVRRPNRGPRSHRKLAINRARRESRGKAC